MKCLFTPAMDAFIVQNHARLSIKQIAAHFGIKYATVAARVQKLNLSKPQNRKAARAWTPRELRILEREFPRLGELKTALLLPGRTPEAVGLKANKMGFTVGDFGVTNKFGKRVESVTRGYVTSKQAARACDVDRDVIVRLATRDGVIQRAGHYYTLVPEDWLEVVRREYPVGTLGIRRSGYIGLTKAAPLIGVCVDTLRDAVIRGLPGPMLTALEGIRLHRAGACTYLNPRDVEEIRLRLKKQRDGTALKAVALEQNLTLSTAKRRYQKVISHAIVGGKRQRIVPEGSNLAGAR